MEDLINSLLVSSDPVITNLSKSSVNKSNKVYVFDKEDQKLLLDYNEESSDSDSDKEN